MAENVLNGDMPVADWMTRACYPNVTVMLQFQRPPAWFSDFKQRPVTKRNRLGVWLAILTCPCHAGWLLILTGSTAVGAWLAQAGPWLYGIFGAAFLASLWVAFGRDPNSCALPLGENQIGRRSDFRAQIDKGCGRP